MRVNTPTNKVNDLNRLLSNRSIEDKEIAMAIVLNDQGACTQRDPHLSATCLERRIII